jgi:hypothetical protein
MGEEPLRDDKIGILNGVLELNTEHVEEIMMPIEVSAIHLFHFQVRRASVHFKKFDCGMRRPSPRAKRF